MSREKLRDVKHGSVDPEARFSTGKAGRLIGKSSRWVRDNLEHFPNAVKVDAQNLAGYVYLITGEDITAFKSNQKQGVSVHA